MKFFELLPRITYDSQYDIRNLFYKYYFPNDIDPIYLTTYRISDGESLESISHELYEDSSLWWLLAILNDIRDVIFDLPLDEDAIQEMAKDLSTINLVLDLSLYSTNYDTLTDENNDKRVIRVVRPEFIQKILTEIVRQTS